MVRKIKNYESFKNTTGSLWHILNFDKLKYIIENNHMTPYRGADSHAISFTTDSSMTGYLGDKYDYFFKLEFDKEKLSEDYEIVPFIFKSKTGIGFEHEKEERVILKDKSHLTDVDKYITKLIVIKPKIDKLLSNTHHRDGEVSDYLSDKMKPNIQTTFKWIMENSPYPIYIQDGEKIYKDDNWLKEITELPVKKIHYMYDIVWRGDVKTNLGKYNVMVDTFITKNNKTMDDVVIGRFYELEHELMDDEEIKNMKAEPFTKNGQVFIPYVFKYRLSKKGNYLEVIRPL